MIPAHRGGAGLRPGHICLFALLWVAAVQAGPVQGGTYQTRNFVVTAPTQDIAEQVGRAAEMYRRELAIQWLGTEMRNWSGKCPIDVKIGQIGAGGATTFNFGGGHVYGWKMSVQGTLERVLDSVLPHEISHTIFACHFRCPLPRWADEGAATLAEHESEKKRQVLTVREVIDGNRLIPLRKLMGMKEYPTDMRDVLTLYAEGYSLAELLVQQGGRERYLLFLSDSLKQGWDAGLSRHYGYKSVDEFEQKWLGWVMAGSPELDKDVLYASRSGAKQGAAKPTTSGISAPIIVRGQNSEEERARDITKVAIDPLSPKRMTSATPLGSDVEAPAPRRRPSEIASLSEPDAANLREDGPIERPARPRAAPAPERPDIAELDTDPRTAVKTAELTPAFDWKRQGEEADVAADEAPIRDREVILEDEPDLRDPPRVATTRSRGNGPRMLAKATIIPAEPEAADESGVTPYGRSASDNAKRTLPARRRPSFSAAPVEPGYRPLSSSRDR